MASIHTAQPAHATINAPDLEAMVKPDSHKRGRAFWRLVPSERPIWAIIMHIIVTGESDDATDASDALIQEVADDYAISNAEVRAAIAYYAKNKTYIDAWLTLTFDTGADS